MSIVNFASKLEDLGFHDQDFIHLFNATMYKMTKTMEMEDARKAMQERYDNRRYSIAETGDEYIRRFHPDMLNGNRLFEESPFEELRNSFGLIRDEYAQWLANFNLVDEPSALDEIPVFEERLEQQWLEEAQRNWLESDD